MQMQRFFPTALFISTLALTLAGSAAAAPHQTYFAEPYTGKKTLEYTVSLPLSRHEKKSFSIPGQCREINSALMAGAGRWGSLVERRLWLKVDDDCRYYSFINQERRVPTHDFVSNHDFMNCDLTMLPIHQACDEHAYHNNPAACPPLPPSVPDLSMYLAMPEGQSNQDSGSADQCQFVDGVFRGYLFHAPIGLSCIRSKSHSGFRILSVDFANINNDDYQDAILRIIQVGRGTKPVPMMLPLTRFEESGSFSIPDGTHFPEMGPVH